jgi:hypothetical protein
MMEMIQKGTSANDALLKATSKYGRFDEGARVINPRHE